MFDALTHDRPYKRAWPVEAAVAEIARGRGQQFDPDVVDAFLGISEEAPVDLGRGTAARTPGSTRPALGGRDPQTHVLMVEEGAEFRGDDRRPSRAGCLVALKRTSTREPREWNDGDRGD